MKRKCPPDGSALVLVPSFDAPDVKIPAGLGSSRAGLRKLVVDAASGALKVATFLQSTHVSMLRDEVELKASRDQIVIRFRQRHTDVCVPSLDPFDAGGDEPWQGAWAKLRAGVKREKLEVWGKENSRLGLGRILLCPSFASPPPNSRLVRPALSSPFSPRAAIDGSRKPSFKSQIPTPFTAVSPKKVGRAARPQILAPIARDNKQMAKSRLTVMSLEMSFTTRGDLTPDPQKDAIAVLVFQVSDIVGNAESETRRRRVGVLCLEDIGMGKNKKAGSGKEATNAIRDERANMMLSSLRLPFQQSDTDKLTLQLFATEVELLLAFVEQVRKLDPDIVMGYEIQFSSWGYLIARGRALASKVDTRYPGVKDILLHMEQSCSRLPGEKSSVDSCLNENRNSAAAAAAAAAAEQNPNDSQEMMQDTQGEMASAPSQQHHAPGGGRPNANAAAVYNENKESGVVLKGRIVLNVWKRMRAELRTTCNTAQAAAAQLLSEADKPRSFPQYSAAQLSRWFHDANEWRHCVTHVQSLAALNLELCDHPVVDLVRRTAEAARLFCIDFFSVLTRGSQYRVEAALLRQAHAQNYLCTSPGKEDVRKQPSLDKIALLLEPTSDFYTDPVIVLDFQSLYPSLVIAHNLCYSTLLGVLNKVDPEQCLETMGCVRYPQTLSADNAYATFGDPQSSSKLPHIAPNGAMFMPKAVREGVLPSLLKMILATRQMVKRAMKEHTGPENAVLRLVLDARQLAIKLLSNVMYGYTAASFSGRMPCSALADAIVSHGARTLDWAINEVNLNKVPGTDNKLKVVYGDTDSLFIVARGCSREEAFDMGEAVMKHINSQLPEPMKLKFEKVYHPSIMFTKKRYVGYAFEKKEQTAPQWDAKGIETVRRDGCGALRKIMESSLRVLFDTSDISRVRSCLESAWSKLTRTGPVSGVFLNDLVFAKEVRMGGYVNNPPGAELVRKKSSNDSFVATPHRWRVPYVVTFGEKTTLRSGVADPKDVLERGSNLRINLNYYLTKVINPPLHRLLSIAGCDVNSWYKVLAKSQPRLRFITYNHGQGEKGTLVQKPKQQQKTMTEFFEKASCLLCSLEVDKPGSLLCNHCGDERNQGFAVLRIQGLLRQSEEREMSARLTCQRCAALAAGPGNAPLQDSRLMRKGELVGPSACRNLDCATLHARVRYVSDIEDLELARTQFAKP